MKRFAIITPTIPGREHLLVGCIGSVKSQSLFGLYEHIVVGDGSNIGAEKICSIFNIKYLNTGSRMGTWAWGARNTPIEQKAIESDYVIFLDDDNLLLPNALTDLNELAYKNNQPAVLGLKILYQQGWDSQWKEYPLGCKHGQWDLLNSCIRTDIALQCKFVPCYDADWYFTEQALKLGNIENPLVTTKVGGIRPCNH